METCFLSSASIADGVGSSVPPCATDSTVEYAAGMGKHIRSNHGGGNECTITADMKGLVFRLRLGLLLQASF